MKNFGKGSMTLKRREKYCEMRRTACFGQTYGLFRIGIRPVFGSTYGRAEERTVRQCGKQTEGWESQRKREGGLAF